MIYAVSDIHGCYDEFMQLLEKIEFSDQDEMFILGDLCDRGDKVAELIKELSLRDNIYCLLGNHDYVAYKLLSIFNQPITDESLNSFDENSLLNYYYWMIDGGDKTSKSFYKLTKEEREDFLDYLSEASLFITVELNGKKYVMVHGGLENFAEDKPLDSYTVEEIIYTRTDYSKRYFSDENTYLVTGHTPTQLINENQAAEVYMSNGHIAIDCGCVFGGRLAAYCLDNGQITYVDSKQRKESE